MQESGESDAAGLSFRVRRLLADDALRASLGRRALEVARPHAARDVLETVLGGLRD